MKIKHFPLIIGFLLLSINLQSQSLLTEGTTWHYNYYIFWQGGFGYNQCYISGDTIIDQKECLIYHRLYQTCDARPITEYIYEEEDKVYYYETNLERFLLLYDYSAQVGDTLAIEYWPGFTFPEDSLFHIKIDSIDLFYFDTFELKQFHVSYDRWDDETIEFFESPNSKGVYIEGIGSTNNFFHFTEFGGCDGSYNIGLRCFTHPTIGIENFSDIPCDSILLAATKEIINLKKIEIYPNPFQHSFHIRSDASVTNPQIVIYNLSGEMVYQTQKQGFFTLQEELQLSVLPSSVYMVNVFELEQDGLPRLIYADRVVKN